MSKQSDLQAQARAIAGTAGQWAEDIHAALTVLGVPQGQFQERVNAYTGLEGGAAFNSLLDEGFARLLLDIYPSAALAYSASRKLRTNYSGAAFRVRRSSDNAEQDIGFLVNGQIDTSALTTFVGANNGFVTTIYDQSGNTRNATQTTAANQPQIVASGSVITENGKPVIRFNGTSQFMELQNAAGTFRNVPLAQALMVEKWTDATEDASLSYTFHFSANTATRSDTRFSHGRSANLTQPRVIGRQQDATTSSSRAASEAVSTNLECWTFYIDYAGTRQIAIARNLNAYISGTISDPAGNTSDTDSLVMRLGAGSNAAGSATSHWNGSIAEMILYASGSGYVSRAQAIITNQMNHYGIS